MNAVLDVQNLYLGVSQKRHYSPILNGVNLEIQRSQIHGLVGESGAGKSMLAKAILGILPSSTTIDKGYIHFKGNDLVGMPRYERRQLASRHIAMIPQDPMTSLNPVRRVGNQLVDVLRLHMKLNRTLAQERVLELLNDVQIRDPKRVVHQYPFELSGGMRQRVLIAMAFSCKPELIIADEPTTALDVTVQRQILQLIKQLQSETGTSVLFISHDLGVIAKICDHVSILHTGNVVEMQSAVNLFQNPRHEYTQNLLEITSHYYRFENID